MVIGLLLALAAILCLLGALGMVPTQAVFERMFVLLGADSVTFSKSAGSINYVILIKEDFTPDPALLIGDLVEADFPGYAAVATKADGVPQSDDPATGDSLLDIPSGAAPYLWETTGTPTPSQTIYGYAVVNNDKTTLYASAKLPSPVILTAINQSVALPRVLLRQLAQTVI